MNSYIDKSDRLFSLSMASVLTAQFFSALADNAILIVAISLMKSYGSQNLDSMLQGAFVIPFIVLAPFLGIIADAYPKGRVMLAGNLLKLVGALLMLQGANPILAYGLIGIGAAIYSPAKYGILSQLVGPSLLVKANGMMEGSTIVAILIGVLLGGWLSDYSLQAAFSAIVISYGLAASINLLIPSIAPEKRGCHTNPLVLLSKFVKDSKQLFQNSDARLSLLGTGIFWASGATLRLLLFAWVPMALLLNDSSTPAKLMGILSIGIVIGAAAASACISLLKVNRALIGGVLIGPLIMMLIPVHELGIAMMAMMAIGICGGFFVVPLNALLQVEGHQSVGSGSALAIQNFVENCGMLLFVGLYGFLVLQGISIHSIIAVFGSILFVSIGSLSLFRLYSKQNKTDLTYVINSKG